MLLSCRDAVDPSAEADERRGGPVDVPDPVQQATPAPQHPGVGQLPDRLLHRGAQPGPGGGGGRVRPRAPVFGASVPDRRVSTRAGLGHPSESRSTRAVTPVASKTARTPETSSNSCSWQLTDQPPSHHSRSPWMVDSATPWAVWVRRLASSRTFWLAHPPGRCTRVARPSTHTASPTWVISASRSRRLGGWPRTSRRAGTAPARPTRPQQVQAVVDLGLADPDHPGGASGDQPVQHHRTQGVQPDLHLGLPPHSRPGS
jgi:hypothetical protein